MSQCSELQVCAAGTTTDAASVILAWQLFNKRSLVFSFSFFPDKLSSYLPSHCRSFSSHQRPDSYWASSSWPAAKKEICVCVCVWNVLNDSDIYPTFDLKHLYTSFLCPSVLLWKALMHAIYTKKKWFKSQTLTPPQTLHFLSLIRTPAKFPSGETHKVHPKSHTYTLFYTIL